MRASEALIAGSMLIKPMGYFRGNVGDSKGCALGMISAALGDKNHYGYEGLRRAENDFPWMREVMVKLPCGCDKDDLYSSDVVGAIVHIFNEHVMQGHVDEDLSTAYKPIFQKYFPKDSWTIEQLADFIEQNDPTPKESKIIESLQEGVVVYA